MIYGRFFIIIFIIFSLFNRISSNYYIILDVKRNKTTWYFPALFYTSLLFIIYKKLWLPKVKSKDFPRKVYIPL